MKHRFRFVSFLTVALVCALALSASPVAADGDQTVGICMIGVDSPCNGDHDENATDRPTDEKDGEAKPVTPDEFPPDPDGADGVLERPADPEPNWRDAAGEEPINDFVDGIPLMQQSGLSDEPVDPKDEPVDSKDEYPVREGPIPTEPYIVCIRAPCELPTGAGAEPLPEKLPPGADGDVGIEILVPADEDANLAVSASNTPERAVWYDFDSAPARFDSNPFHLFARLFGFFY
ncbi:hypothetical protein [Haloarchaeobius sp. DT45]|uniref:hypothetical protein n=1 Tax=Haloarchaeobius sp. DT45 TaxID=3446116 RepID=UPI003F6B0464